MTTDGVSPGRRFARDEEPDPPLAAEHPASPIARPEVGAAPPALTPQVLREQRRRYERLRRRSAPVEPMN